MNKKPHTKSWLKWIVPMLVMALILAACGPAEDREVAPDFGFDETPFAPVAPGEPDPLATPAITPDVVGTPVPIVVEETPETAPPVAPDVAATPEPEVGLEDRTIVVRATDLIGMNVVNIAGDTIGDVSEVLVDRDGEIVYVFFDAGGFLGIGARTTAVGWEAFEVRSERHQRLMLPGSGVPPADPAPPSGTQPQPGTPGATPAPGTGAQPQPGVGAQPQPGSDFDAQQPYIVLDQTAVLVYRGDMQTLQTAVEIDDAALDRDTFIWNRRDLGLDLDSTVRPEAEQLLPLTWFTGLTGRVDLVNHQGEDLGNVTDLIVVLQKGHLRLERTGTDTDAQPGTAMGADQDDGFVMYAVVDVGGFLGIGATTVLVPWNMIEIDEQNEQLILDVDRATLENIPTHEWGTWRDPLDRAWDEEIRDWWQQQGWTPRWSWRTQ